jgi:hypothetical protein
MIDALSRILKPIMGHFHAFKILHPSPFVSFASYCKKEELPNRE